MPNLFHGSTAIYAATDAAGKYKVALETLAISNASVLVVGTFSALQYTSVRPEQPEKASSPIDVTLLGIVIDVRPEQPEKAELPIDVTLLGIVIDVRPEQLSKAKFPIDVTLYVFPSQKKEDGIVMLPVYLLLKYLDLTLANLLVLSR